MSNNETTIVDTVEIDLDAIVQESVGGASAANIVVPATPKIIRTDEEDALGFLNDLPLGEAGADKDDEKPNIDAIVAETVAAEDPAQPNKGGRPVVTKDLLLDVVGALVEDETISLFEDSQDLSKYTKEDLIDLLKSNFDQKEEKYKTDVPVQFFDALPEKLQYAAKYVADGGRDLESLFSTLLQQEKIEKLDPDSEAGQKAIARQYLEFTRYGTPEEIEEEVTGWQDRGELPKKAAQFKPKLEDKNKEVIEQTVKRQEALRKQQEAASEEYVANVFSTLKDAQLNGIKLDKKTQSLLYTGLVQANYKSYTGQNTNLLGHLLEKYQVVEPNHELIAEVLWHLADPEGFKSKLKEGGEKTAVEKTVRALKTEQATRSTGNGIQETADNNKKVTRTVSRPAERPKFTRL